MGKLTINGHFPVRFLHVYQRVSSIYRNPLDLMRKTNHGKTCRSSNFDIHRYRFKSRLATFPTFRPGVCRKRWRTHQKSFLRIITLMEKGLKASISETLYELIRSGCFRAGGLYVGKIWRYRNDLMIFGSRHYYTVSTNKRLFTYD